MKEITLLLIIMTTSCFAQNENNLLLHYKFDGNTLDETANGFNGLENNVTYVADRHGIESSAAYFNGVDSFINFPNLAELKPQLPVSFSFWVKYDTGTYQQKENFNTSFEENRSSGIYFNSQISNGNFAINYGDGSLYYSPSARRSYTSNYTIVENEWKNIIVVVNSELDMKIYIDCKESGGSYSGSGGNLFYSMGAGSLGRNDRNLDVPANYFKGTLDDFKYWDKALSDEDIYIMCSPLGTSELPTDTFTFYPNPAKRTLYVESKKKPNFT